jgi:hypothetical protein
MTIPVLLVPEEFLGEKATDSGIAFFKKQRIVPYVQTFAH